MNSSHSTLHIAYKENYIEEKVSTKFLGLQTDNHIKGKNHINPLNAELNPICHLLALLEAHHILHVSRIRVKEMIPKWSMLCHQVSRPFQ